MSYVFSNRCCATFSLRVEGKVFSGSFDSDQKSFNCHGVRLYQSCIAGNVNRGTAWNKAWVVSSIDGHQVFRENVSPQVIFSCSNVCSRRKRSRDLLSDFYLVEKVSKRFQNKTFRRKKLSRKQKLKHDDI
ncbi:hypothetical protein MNBD_PLANCTO02-824 [hydrothermal vent metagenome]|uniref:Uncharacterized protein n=1 Tax=hydrothermal vent metagenome TaxID=652676 RepID=A0A3B1DFR8_9ZZZZ